MKRLSFFLSLIFVMPLFLVGCGGESEINSYKIVCEYDESAKSLTTFQETTFVNNSNNALSSVSLFLYPNSFKEVAVSNAYFDRCYPNGESFGGVEIESVESEEQELKFEIKNNEILSVTLLETLFPSEKVTFSIYFTVKLANVNHRLGYGENVINFGNFYPILCVYDDGFVENSFAKNGDPFYSDVANYDVTITYNKAYTLVSSGDILSTNEENGKKVTHIKGEKLRDFCFVLSTEFEVISQTVNGKEINYYFYDDQNAQENLALCVKVMDEFSNMFGDYPYKSVNIVKTNFCFGGMEYPNLVYISDAIQDESTYQYCIVHELAHQWWYSLVGNNEYEEAWLDESLTEYSTVLFFEKHSEYGFEYQEMIAGSESAYRLFVEIYTDILGDVDESMNRNLSEFETEPEYVNNVYTKGVLMFDNLRSLVGDNKFFKALREYFEEYKYKNASQEDLINVFIKVSHQNLKGYFDSWLCGEVVFVN